MNSSSNLRVLGATGQVGKLVAKNHTGDEWKCEASVLQRE